MAAASRGSRLVFANSMIVLDFQTFQQARQSDNVTGTIFLELQGRAFPDRGWSDFPVIILGWWIDAWLQLEVPTRRKVQWLFMDGPYAATITKVAVSDTDAALRSSQVCSSLLEAGERVVAYCDQHDMISRDLELLRDKVSRLKANQRRAEDAGFALQFAFGRQRLGASDSGRSARSGRFSE